MYKKESGKQEMGFDDFFQIEPYSLEKVEKEKLLTKRLINLTELHREGCPEYQRILESISYDKDKMKSYRDLPFLPVRLFKEISLISVPQKDIVKTMTS